MPTPVHPTLIDLFHHRWAVPVVGALWELDGAKFVTLQRRLGVSRESLRFILRVLMERRLVMRNPGYGHPLRPEYILDEWGRWIGEDCAALVEGLQAAGALEVGLRKWSMPLVAAIGREKARFSELEMALGGITPRALTGGLRDLVEAELAERDVLPSFPPSARYRLSAAGLGTLRPLEGIHEAIQGRPRNIESG